MLSAQSMLLNQGLGNTSVTVICKLHFNIQLFRLCVFVVATFHLPRIDLSDVILG